MSRSAWTGYSKTTIALADLTEICGPQIIDTPDGLQSLGESGSLGTKTPIDPAWRSPWASKSMDNILSFMQSLPESHVAINREHFVIVTHTLEERGTLWCYRVGHGEGVEDRSAAEGETASTPFTRFACQATEAAEMLFPMQSGDWERYVEEYVLRPDHDDAGWWDRGIPSSQDERCLSGPLASFPAASGEVVVCMVALTDAQPRDYILFAIPCPPCSHGIGGLHLASHVLLPEHQHL